MINYEFGIPFHRKFSTLSKEDLATNNGFLVFSKNQFCINKKVKRMSEKFVEDVTTTKWLNKN